MKKLSLSVIGMSVVAAFALPVQAANTGTIELRGSVAQNCGVVVSTLAKASALSITGGESNATVGTVQETCNVANGYTVTLGSANAGKLKNGSSEVAFSVAYDNATGAISSGMTADRTDLTGFFCARLNVVFFNLEEGVYEWRTRSMARSRRS